LAGLGVLIWQWVTPVWPPADPLKARTEVQRFYDKRAPGRYMVKTCVYVKDPEGSEFDRFDCEVARLVPCLQPGTSLSPGRLTHPFSVPRAGEGGTYDFDPMPLISAECAAP
jgi:hypothetical protein